MRVSYDVSHDFSASKTNVKLTAATGGNTLGAEIDDRQLKEVSLERDVDVGDNKVNVDGSWLVKAQTARVKLMSNLGGSSDKVKAQVCASAVLAPGLGASALPHGGASFGFPYQRPTPTFASPRRSISTRATTRPRTRSATSTRSRMAAT